jgi:hypothetical protein
MAAMANLLVKDDATSPVEITFVPITDTPNPFWRAGIAGVPLDGQPRVSVTQEKVKSGAYKYTVKVEVPVMETLGASGSSAGYVAPPKVAYTNTCIFTMFADARSTIADRANALKLVVGLLQGASATTATGILSNTAAGDAWKTSTLPFPLIFTNGVLPN